MKQLIIIILSIGIISCSTERKQDQITEGVTHVIDAFGTDVYKVKIDTSEYILVVTSHGAAICKHQ